MSSVEVITGARLHFGLICAEPGSNWHYGGIGLMIDSPGWKIRVSRREDSSADLVTGSDEFRHRINRLMVSWRENISPVASVQVEAVRESTFHTGLGCGTQLTLAAAAGLLVLSGRGRPWVRAGHYHNNVLYGHSCQKRRKKRAE